MDKMDTKEMLKARGNRYGRFDGHAGVTYGLKRVMVRSRQWDNLSDDMKEALDMIAHKIGRILNGDPEYDDSWRDIAGYATLIVQRLNKEGEYAEETTLATRSDSLDTPRDAGRTSDSDDNFPSPEHTGYLQPEYNLNAGVYRHQRHSKLSCPSLLQLVTLFGEAGVVNYKLVYEATRTEVNQTGQLKLRHWFAAKHAFEMSDINALELEYIWNRIRFVIDWRRDLYTSVYIKG